MASRTSRRGLLFGPVAAAIFITGVGGLPWLIPGYGAVRQSVSEIGEIGSPAQGSFALILYLAALCLGAFAYALQKESVDRRHGSLAAYLTGFMALLTAGLQAPLAFGLAWRHDLQSTRVVRFSWIMFAMLWFAILLNLVTFDRHGTWWSHVQPFYGLVQRSLFVAWFTWCAGIGLLLWRGPCER